MTTETFYRASVFDGSAGFFSEGSHETADRRFSSRTSSVSDRLLRSAVAAGISLITLHTPTISASTLRVDVTSQVQAEAAIQVPRLTPQQASAARLFRNAFKRVPAGEDAAGDDPDYGF